MTSDAVYILMAGGALSYFLGAIPFSLLLGFVTARKDIREFGSGNTGATNLARTVNYPVGVIGLVLDYLKGFVPVFWGASKAIAIAEVPEELLWWGGDAALWIPVSYGAAAIVGHCFPVYLQFRGGKGVATSLGVFSAIIPIPTAIAFGVWLLVVVTSGYVALGSIMGAVSLPLAYLFTSSVPAFGLGKPVLLISFLAAVLVVARHHSNIRRLIEGEEEKFNEPMQSEQEEKQVHE